MLRDTDGFQYGFMDQTEGVQWRNELKFDVEVLPSYPGGKPALRLEKFYLSYRGAYDAIFDLRDKYDTVRDETTAASGIPEESWRLTAMVYNDYLHGQVKPSIFVMYDPEGTWMSSAGVEYSPDGRWYYKLSQISFYGNKDADSSFAPMIGTSELSLRAGYRW